MNEQQQQNIMQEEDNINVIQLQKIFTKRANVYYMIIAMQIRIEQLGTFLPLRFRSPPMVLKELQSGFQLTEHFYLLRQSLNTVPQELHKQIFNQTISLLQLLSLNNLYIKGSLLDTIVIYYNPLLDRNHVDVQPFGQLFQSNPQNSDQIEELRQFLGQQHNFSINKFSDVKNIVFPSENNLNAPIALEDTVAVVKRISDINLLENEAKLLLLEKRELSNEDILFFLFRNKMKSFEDLTTQKCSLELWIILARFLKSQQAVRNVLLLPFDLDRYVRYDNPEPLPDYIQNICGYLNILERLRVVLGVYPHKVQFYNEGYCLENINKLPESHRSVYSNIFRCKNHLSPEQLEVGLQLPIWLYQRLQQLAFLSEPEAGIQTKNEIICDGPTISCPNTLEGYVNLLKKVLI